jgi:ATP-dependent DNA helicase RecG
MKDSSEIKCIQSEKNEILESSLKNRRLSSPTNRPPPSKYVVKTSTQMDKHSPQLSFDQHSTQILGTTENQSSNGIFAACAEHVSMDYVNKCLTCLAKLEQPIRQLSGVGEKTEAHFHKLEIYTLRDLLWNFPRAFIDRSHFQKSIYDVADGDLGTFRLVIHNAKIRNNSVTCTDETGNSVDITFFYGRSWRGMIMASTAMKKMCNAELDSVVMIVSGKITHSEFKSEIFNPDIVISPNQSDSLGIEAVYCLTAGLTQKKIKAAVDEALGVASELFKLLPESLPSDVLERLRWPTLADAFQLAHKPKSMEEAGIDSPYSSRQRIAFEELSMQQAQVALSRWKLKHCSKNSHIQRKEAYSSWRDSPLVSTAVSSLPFLISGHQIKCLDELWDDAVVGGNGRMLRLLQGEVGSGKTVLAYLLGLGCIESPHNGGRIVCIMCPTQLLASQHMRTITDYATQLNRHSDWNVKIELLNGSVTGKLRHELLCRLEKSGEKEAVFLIGTQALTTPDIVKRIVQLPIALAIIDEEHRFGVRQRSALTQCSAHSLFMSATPIPRSISLKRCGLVDFTRLEAEPRRVETTIISSDNLQMVLTVLEKKIEQGSKCFWVVPRIDGNEEFDSAEPNSFLNNVEDRFKMLVDKLGEERVCCVHGRMRDNEREANIARFADPSTQAAILVGTTVIEGKKYRPHFYF